MELTWQIIRWAAAIAHRVWPYLVAFATGFTLKDLLSVSLKKFHVWVESRIDHKVIAYLIQERESHPPVGPNGYGQYSQPFYRSSIEVAEALKRTSVDTRKRLERLETENQVERLAPATDLWTATKYAMHDKSRK
jgi:hypothetical protein